MNDIHPLRLLLKAVSLFILGNLLFALWNPPVGRVSAYNLVFPGRTRFPFGAGVADSNITVDDLDAMFGSHVISVPKPQNEFRVVILGDSSIWGTLLYADQTIDAQLNDIRNIHFACPAKFLRFYNLGYPHPSVVQDLVILQKALEYKPDLVIWAITPNSLRPRPLNVFLTENMERVIALTEQYHLSHQAEDLKPVEKTLFERTFIGQSRQLSRLLLLQSLAVHWAGTALDIAPIGDYQKLSNNVEKSLAFGQLQPPASIEPLLMLDYLNAGVQISGNVPLLLVNEPMFAATGKNSDRRYNAMYPRWAYDQYRQILAERASAGGWHYLDAWDVVPPADFTDYELHISPEGEQLLAKALKPAIEKTVCR